MSRITDLAREIAENTKIVEDYLKHNGLEIPSFSADGPVDFGINDKAVQLARAKAAEASLILHDLLQGPQHLLRPPLIGTALHAIYKYNIAAHVPLSEGPISFKALSNACGLDEPELRQCVRYAIAYHHVFDEPTKGFIAHSAASRLLVEDPSAYDSIGLTTEETLPACTRTIAAKGKWNDSKEPNHTGFSLAMDTDLPMFSFYQQNPANAKRFGGAMKHLSGGAIFESSILATQVDWPGKTADGAAKPVTIVDVGGSKGHISIGLAAIAPYANFVVQDLDEVIETAKQQVPPELRDRISLQVYDFFTEQQVKGADVYLFSHILHNWSDEHVLRILANLKPALVKGSKVVISDAIMPEPNTLGLLQERGLRAMDMLMWTFYNSRERDRDDWTALLKQADERFTDVKFHTGDTAWGVIETTWAG